MHRVCGTDRWDGATDLAETTPSNWRGGDWRVSTADGLGLGGNSGRRRSSKGLAGAQSASQLYANNHFRSSLRMYPHSGGDIRSQQDMLLDNATGNVSILRDPVFTEPVHEITVAACPSAAVAPPSRSGSVEADETERARAFAAVQRLAGMVGPGATPRPT